MIRLTLKNLAANKARFTLTTFAVVLAVSFVVSSFVLGDGLRSTFGGLSEEIVAGTDLELRPVETFGDQPLLDEALLDEVRAIDGVAAAAPTIAADDNTIRPIKADGEEVTSSGPPVLAIGWIENDQLNSFTIVEGSAPDDAGEFAMDLDAAATNGFVVGESYDVVAPTGRTTQTLTAITRFGENNDTLGATLMQFQPDALQELTASDGYATIVVALEDPADKPTVEAAMAVLDDSAEVVDNATLESETKADFNAGIDLIGNILLGFAGISLFVSIFIIYNTFSIVLGQRTRELALLRTIGADPGQLRRSVAGEALVIGVLASAVGIGAGVGVAIGLAEIFSLIGADLPDAPLIVSLRTVLVAAAVGIGATVISAVGPARKASSVPPIAALRDGADAGQRSGRTRLAIGAAVTALGLLFGGLGLFAASTTGSVISLLALGSMGVFIGVTLISPVVARPLTAVMGWPFSRMFGLSGDLARQNAGRNPHRTATTAAALMIGLALVSTVLVVGESVKAQLRVALTSSVSADYLVTESTYSGFPLDLRDELAATPVVETIASFRSEEMEVDGEVVWVDATDLASATQLFDLDIVEGVGSDATVTNPTLVHQAEAEARNLGVGDQVSVLTGTGATADLTVIGLFADDFVIEDPFLIELTTWDELGGPPVDEFIALALADGVTTSQADAAFAPVAENYPQADIATSGDFVANAEGIIDQALATVNVFVALAVIIALIGIANTLALSVFERTRELGLLRAIGMTRRQVRSMVRFEAGLVALFGATLGVTVGIGFGWAAVAALPSTFTSVLAIPVARIAILVVVAAVAGLVAAWGPARRAGRLKVLDAIAH